MKNIINEKPTDKLYGRTLYTTSFVSDKDVNDKKILNIGSGFGWFELNVLDRGVKEIIGLEISENDLEVARKEIKDPRASFKVGSAIKIPFDDNSFDTVVSWAVIEHIPKGTENIMFNEVYRILKPNGIFYISTPYDSFFAKIFDPAWWLQGHRHYNKCTLSILAHKNKFIFQKCIIAGGWWCMIGMINLYISKWIFRRRSFWDCFMHKKQDEDYFKERGFNTIFIKLKK